MANFIFLVPGFLGYTRLGPVSYFSAAFSQHLRRELALHGHPNVPVVALDTVPAGSLGERQAKLCAQVQPYTLQPGARFHFIGHSTGALDVELVLRSNPLVAAPPAQLAAVRHQTHTLVALAGAAGGSGIAASEVGRALAGASRLQASKLAKALGVDIAAGGVELASGLLLHPSALVAAASAVPLLWTDPMARQAVAQLFNSPAPVLQYLGQLALNRKLLRDLVPKTTRQFLLQAGPLASAAVIRRFLTVAPPPPAYRGSPASWLFSVLHDACAAGTPDHDPLYTDAVAALRARWASLPITNKNTPLPALAHGTSDGVVNTALQLPQASHADLAAGVQQIAGLVVADHLDVIGAIPTQGTQHTTAGLLNSGAKFGDPELRTLCRLMVDEIAPQL